LAGGAIVNTNNPGYSGSGFVDFMSTNGASLTLPLSGAPAGLQYLTVRYAAGGGDSTATSIFVDGVALPAVTFAGTVDWNTWTDSPPLLVSLASAGSSVRVVNGAGAPINVDYLSVTPFRGAFYEGESATLSGGATVMADHPRYTGRGFVDFKATSGASATFNVSAEAAGPHTVVLRYAAGEGTAVKGMQTNVNGALAPAVSYASTGSWNYWQSSEPQVVMLNAGENTIQLVNTTAPFMNVDSLTVLPGAQLPCVHESPSATIAPPVGTAPAGGGAATYTVTVTNLDAAACPAATFHLDAATLGLAATQVTFANNDVSIAPGASATMMLTVTVVAAPAATYPVSTWVTNGASSEAAIATAAIELH
jgi:hypothetical protein